MKNDEIKFQVTLGAVLIIVFLCSLFPTEPKKKEVKQPIIVNNYITNPVVRTEVVYRNISSSEKE